ncbi:MAG TPA: hypothetical protein ENK85_01945 [Saprospiraceae bacterium]|nr:hypothetical protein [Saprospiraceae bacterium]
MSFKHIAFLFLAVSAFWVTSCKKEPISSDHKITSFVATLGGTPWKADTSYSEINEDDDQIIVFGKNNDFSVKMTLAGAGKGKFNLDDADNDLFVQSATTAYHYLEGTGGKVELTLNDKVDHALSGVFSGMLVDTLLDTLVVEGGVFTHIKYLDTTGTGGPGPTICPVNMIAASLDGNALGLTFLGATKLGNSIQIIGSNAASLENVQIVFPADIVPGTYSFTGTSPIATYSKTSGTNAVSYNSISGTLVIEAHNVAQKSVKGTFSFTAQEIGGGTGTKDITGGNFCAKYN